MNATPDAAADDGDEDALASHVYADEALQFEK